MIQPLIILLGFHTINPLAESSFIKLPKEVDHPRKGLINIQYTNDHECFNWFLVRYLNPEDRNPTRVTKADEDFGKKLDFKDIKFPIKTRDIYKFEKKNFLVLAFLVMKTK